MISWCPLSILHFIEADSVSLYVITMLVGRVPLPLARRFPSQIMANVHSFVFGVLRCGRCWARRSQPWRSFIRHSHTAAYFSSYSTGKWTKALTAISRVVACQISCRLYGGRGSMLWALLLRTLPDCATSNIVRAFAETLLGELPRGARVRSPITRF